MTALAALAHLTAAVLRALAAAAAAFERSLRDEALHAPTYVPTALLVDRDDY